LQSHQAWTTLLSSTALLRGTNQRLLAWGAAPWKCSYGQRYPRFAQSLLCQNPFGNQICDHPRRQRILRPQDRRLVGREQSPFCTRRQPHPTIKRKLAHLKYVSVSPGVQTAEFYYQPMRWFHPYRFVVIRRPQSEELDQQLTLFKLGSYHYQVLVTNLALRPLNVWRFYNDRAGIERIIRELKADYPLGNIPTLHFFANDFYFHLLLLSYTLVTWFKRLFFPGEFRPLRSIGCAIVFC